MSGQADAETPSSGTVSDQAILDALARMLIVTAHTPTVLSPLAGGVSSDIYRAELPSRVIASNVRFRVSRSPRTGNAP